MQDFVNAKTNLKILLEQVVMVQKSEETVIADQLDHRKETSNQPTVHSADQTDLTDIAAGNTKKNP